MTEDDSAPGWAAINKALAPLYGSQEPLHWAPTLHHVLGGPDPIDGISAYRRQDPLPHWHFVTYGFSELYEKDSTDPDTSGFGFELTFRLLMSQLEDPPPSWVYSFLQNLARYVFSTGNPFDLGHYIHLNGPIALGSDTKLWAVVFAADPELPAIDTPHGRLNFLQVIGITLEELSAIKAWKSESFLRLAEPRLRLLVTDLDRPSLTDDGQVRAAVEQGIATEGSSTASLFVGEATWRVDRRLLGRDHLEVTLGANGIRDFCAVLPGRLRFGRDLCVVSKEASILFRPSSTCSWAAMGNGQLELNLTANAAAELAAMVKPVRGSCKFASYPELVVRVTPSEIRNHEGKVIEVIG